MTQDLISKSAELLSLATRLETLILANLEEQERAAIPVSQSNCLRAAIAAANAAAAAILTAHNAATGPAQIILLDLISRSRDTACDLETLATYLKE